MTRDAVRRAIRTFVITTLALFIPGLLGWLNALTDWARSEGQRPFPDGHGLAYLGVSAITAGVVALINLAWNAVEDAAGKGMLREVPAKSPGEGGYAANDGVALLVVGLMSAVVGAVFGLHVFVILGVVVGFLGVLLIAWRVIRHH